MGLPSIFSFERLTIKPDGGTGDEFVAMFNPTNFSIKFKNRFQETQAVGSGNNAEDGENNGTGGRQLGRDITQLSIRLILDGTGVSDFGIVTGFGLLAKNINEQVDDFLDLTMKTQELTHEANTLKISWGNAINEFSCNLKSVNVTYTLFDRDGTPLRAELDCLFISKNVTADSIIKLSSPDLTHMRRVMEGDTLPAMCASIYGSEKYYLKVAQVNGLDNFRDLEAGREIFFPPIAK